MAKIDYEENRMIMEDDLSLTLLEISKRHSIPHVNACQANARCSTCRVLVLENLDNVLPRNEKELNLAQKKGFENNIRLACQTRITGDVKLRLLVQDEYDVKMALAESNKTTGREQKIVILFSDIRGYTSFSEEMLPYDTVHILNRYFLIMGEVVHKYNGYIDKYMGDGLMVLFGIEGESQDNCLNAVLAAQGMIREMKEMNTYLNNNFNVQLEIGIGIHYGEVILGEVGHPDKMQLTAIGDSVNTASRIESMCKKTGSTLLISEEVYLDIKSRLDKLDQKEEVSLEAYQKIKGNENLLIPRKVFKAKLKGKGDYHRLYSLKELPVSKVSLKMSKTKKESEVLRDFLIENISIQTAPKFLRLAFHDAMLYDHKKKTKKVGGGIRFPEIFLHPVNKGLENPIESLYNWKTILKEKYDLDISYADIIYFSGAVAVEKCGGPLIKLSLGRKDARDITEAGNPALIPTVFMSIKKLIKFFKRLNLTPRDMTALSGAHTLGSNAEGKPFTEDLLTFSNSYFKRLVVSDDTQVSLLVSDKVLLRNKSTEKLVRLYSVDEDQFFLDFKVAYIKMSSDQQF